ncbi:Pre-mRNA-splicing helicase BRR2 [Fusarium irregulare]|uniref:Pre-mRNA-splicing helicase BRR2 n=1 Tax=Fusarium irregulare TaxID=2494466 RepID=A0A9W8U5G8_9HYPO|nr:Pre-mRNA-splicing helicase BRR2 [Fusarium irregulare]KAJ4024938.1 Pre-mRNA-splicing helicase BRR2 [Fusarium irregulare]
MEDITYRPRTAATRAIFDSIITIVANNLGDVPHEVVCSTADAVLEYLKDDNIKGLDKKREVDDILGVTLRPKQWNGLVALGKKITDYGAQDDDENNSTA